MSLLYGKNDDFELILLINDERTSKIKINKNKAVSYIDGGVRDQQRDKLARFDMAIFQGFYLGIPEIRLPQETAIKVKNTQP
ncbi:hypothetical protein HC752_07515 [Vibrio sp. S9_S30]|uniref:hypothetical protein n=1 Tax=Vibrio sp. S9_S30 TaxID=2720226 RepID=UPI00167FEB37|nr:hypothetical protein [Vibrio sp. S9_S30]MBD1556781.1 hypothetical protein [Vibrio sp. S9_S30]